MNSVIASPLSLAQLISEKDKDLVKMITGARRAEKSFLLIQIYYDSAI
jgi:succinate dehydrogenase flavin-adding protein (antitoxin of CptAB toxin-antitoxin module)